MKKYNDRNKTNPNKLLTKKRVVVGIVILCLLTSCSIIKNPILWPKCIIERYIQTLTPLGTSFEDVLDYCENEEEWQLAWYDYDVGFDDYRGPEKSLCNRKTYKHINCYIGEFWLIFSNSVEVFWGFDENGMLIDIFVRKTIDSL